MIVAILRLLQIAWFDILLSGDNAVVIAAACARLPMGRRRLAIGLGAGAAIVLRLLFALAALSLLSLAYVKIIGAALLVWIAIRLTFNAPAEGSIAPAPSLWSAVRAIALADALMSLDNVLAITAAAHDDVALIAFGILLSIPFIIFGAALFLRLLDQYRWLIWAGAGLLGWVAGELAASDPALARAGASFNLIDWAAGACGAACVFLGAGAARAWRGGARRKA